MAKAPLVQSLAAERVASLLPPLLVAAERVASTVAQGVHGRRRVGQGETFWQFRDYDFGDPPQSIDWRQSAKSTRVFVREMEWEAAQSVWIWRDASASMDWQSHASLPTKRARAELLALALAALLLRGGERVALLGATRRPASGRAVLGRMAAMLDSGGGEPDLDDGAGLPPRLPLPRYSEVALFGDFLVPLAAVEGVVSSYAERGVKGTLMQVLDPAEEALPFEGRIRFEGLEGEAPWLLSRTEAVREAYVERMATHRDGLAAIARAAGWRFMVHHSDHPPESALLALYVALSERLR